jgi:hypothetical protein
VEALICTQDWLGGSPTPLPTQEDMEDLEKIERGNVTLILKICFMSLKNAIVNLTKSNLMYLSLFAAICLFLLAFAVVG